VGYWSLQTGHLTLLQRLQALKGDFELIRSSKSGWVVLDIDVEQGDDRHNDYLASRCIWKDVILEVEEMVVSRRKPFAREQRQFIYQGTRHVRDALS